MSDESSNFSVFPAFPRTYEQRGRQQKAGWRARKEKVRTPWSKYWSAGTSFSKPHNAIAQFVSDATSRELALTTLRKGALLPHNALRHVWHSVGVVGTWPRGKCGSGADRFPNSERALAQNCARPFPRRQDQGWNRAIDTRIFRPADRSFLACQSTGHRGARCRWCTTTNDPRATDHARLTHSSFRATLYAATFFSTCG